MRLPRLVTSACILPLGVAAGAVAITGCGAADARWGSPEPETVPTEGRSADAEAGEHLPEPHDSRFTAAQPSRGGADTDTATGVPTARHRPVVPDLAGLTVEGARLVLEGFPAPVRVVVFEDTGTVTGSFPHAGEPVAPGEDLVVWVGPPPTPPPAAPEPAVEHEDAARAAQIRRRVEEAAAARAAAGAGSPSPADGGAPARESPRRMPESEAGTVLEGRASWYGPGFKGSRTACGGTFDPAELTLATRELRCGTRVLVTGPHGATVATATDWGPAEWTRRRFDLSRATFDAVAPLSRGVVDITVEVID